MTADYKQGTWTPRGKQKFPLEFKNRKHEREFWDWLRKDGRCEECNTAPVKDLLGWAIIPETNPATRQMVIRLLCPHHAQVIIRSESGGRA